MPRDIMPTIDPTAAEVLRMLHDGGYHLKDERGAPGRWVDLASAQRAAVSGTRLFTPGELDALIAAPPHAEHSTRIEIVDATTQVAAVEIATQQPPDAGSVAALNFASALNPGGGFLIGARAQEEDLCRCSGLYPTLLEQPRYYEANAALGSHRYGEHIIYSPAVPFFRVAATAPLLDPPALIDVITAPAPNTTFLAEREPDALPALPAIFRRRWRAVLAAAEVTARAASAPAARKSSALTTLVLGAWGAGAFGNDPRLVASAAHDALNSPRFQRSFARVVFAIPSFSGRSAANLAAFREVFPEAEVGAR